MKLALVFIGFAGAAQAGVAAYDACLSEGYEARVLAKFTERFPSETCSGPDCDPWLMKSAEGLVRADCRALALDDCLSTKCREGLRGRWQADADRLQAAITRRIASLNLDALPALQSRRLSDPARWASVVECVGDATACDAMHAGQWLGDLERIQTELDGLE